MTLSLFISTALSSSSRFPIRIWLKEGSGGIQMTRQKGRPTGGGSAAAGLTHRWQMQFQCVKILRSTASGEEIEKYVFVFPRATAKTEEI